MSLHGMEETESNGNKQKAYVTDSVYSLPTLLH